MRRVTSEPTSVDGQPLGKRGLKTRQKILEAVAGAIEQQGLRGLRLADVAAEVGFSPPAFYQYFNDLDEAILTLCEEVGGMLPPFAFPRDGDGAPPDPDESTRAFVERFLSYWDEHRALLWARNVAVTSGDQRFSDVRNETFKPMRDALTERIAAGQREGRIASHVKAVPLGAVLTVMLDRAGMLAPLLREHWTEEEAAGLSDALAYVFDRVLGVDSTGAPAS